MAKGAQQELGGRPIGKNSREGTLCTENNPKKVPAQRGKKKKSIYL